MIKTIIFDFDGTLYNAENSSEWDDYIKNILENVTNTLSPEIREEFIDKYLLRDTTSYFDISDALIKEFGSSAPLVDYIEAHPFLFNNSRPITFIDSQLIKDLSKQNNLYIVSGSPISYLKANMKFGGLDENCFKGLYCCVHTDKAPSKLPCYQQIIKEECVNSSEVLVIGDTYDYDLVPALELGAHIASVKTLEDVYLALQNRDN